MEEKKELEQDFKKEIEEKMTTSFTISYIPVPLFRWFKEFCQKETRDNYAMGIRILKSYHEFYQDMMPHLASISDEINLIKERLDRIEDRKEKPIKTFGEK